MFMKVWFLKKLDLVRFVPDTGLANFETDFDFNAGKATWSEELSIISSLEPSSHGKFAKKVR